MSIYIYIFFLAFPYNFSTTSLFIHLL